MVRGVLALFTLLVLFMLVTIAVVATQGVTVSYLVHVITVKITSSRSLVGFTGVSSIFRGFRSRCTFLLILTVTTLLLIVVLVTVVNIIIKVLT